MPEPLNRDHTKALQSTPGRCTSTMLVPYDNTHDLYCQLLPGVDTNDVDTSFYLQPAGCSAVTSSTAFTAAWYTCRPTTSRQCSESDPQDEQASQLASHNSCDDSHATYSRKHTSARSEEQRQSAGSLMLLISWLLSSVNSPVHRATPA